MTRYRDRTVVVTGAGSGLGAAMADLFAGEGARIALLDIDGERVEAKAAQLRAAGREALSAGWTSRIRNPWRPQRYVSPTDSVLATCCASTSGSSNSARSTR